MPADRRKPRRLAAEIVETARDLRNSGILDAATEGKITMRHLGPGGGLPTEEMLSPEEIRALRAQARMSQAVFARHLRLTPGYVSQLERGAKRPSGPALVLLNLIRRKGIQAIL